MSIDRPNRNLIEAAQNYSVSDEQFEAFREEVILVYTDVLDCERGEKVPFKMLKDALVEHGKGDLDYPKALMRGVLDGWVESTNETDWRRREIWLESDESRRTWRQIVSQEEPSSTYECASYALEELSDEVQVVTIPETKEFYACHSGIWTNDGEQVLRERLEDYMGTDYSRSVLNSAKEYILANWSVSRDDFGVPANTLPLQNGLLNLEERELNPIRADDRITEQLPTEYDPEAECPQFQEFLDTVVPSAEKQQKLQEFIGYCLLPSVPYKKALMLLGESNTSKSTFLRAVEQLFRGEDIAHVSPERLQRNRFASANIEHKMVNIVDELDDHQLKQTDQLKQAISGDPMTAERKHEQQYRFTPRCKHIFASNMALKVPRSEDAFWRRWITIEFENQIPKDDQTPTDEMQSTFDQEAPGILNWALEGVDRLQSQEQFTSTRTPDETHQLWTEFGDVLSEFIEVAIETQSESYVFTADLYDHYKEFCAKTGREVTRTQYRLTQEFNERGVGEHGEKWDPRRENNYTIFKDVTLCDLDSQDVAKDVDI